MFCLRESSWFLGALAGVELSFAKRPLPPVPVENFLAVSFGGVAPRRFVFILFSQVAKRVRPNPGTRHSALVVSGGVSGGGARGLRF